MYTPLQAEPSLYVVPFGVGIGIDHRIVPKLGLRGFINGGAYYGFLNQKSYLGKSTVFHSYATAGSGIYYLLVPSLSVGIEAAYRYFFGLYNGIAISLGTSIYIGGGKKVEKEQKEKELPPKPVPIEDEVRIEIEKKLVLGNITFENVFPILFKYYDEHPVGKATMHNTGTTSIQNIKVSLFVKQYMDVPTVCRTPDVLKGGESKEIELNALFMEKVLEITEGTKVAAEITVEYTKEGRKSKDEYWGTIRLYDRNAITWDDNRKAAAFVTSKDPVVLQFSKNIAGVIKGQENKTLNKNLSLALALFNALSLYGISYAVDPTTPYAEFSKKVQAVDFLQFPKQTLEYGAGDCDDLSILFSALLESVGIETAFIILPEHIFVAFSLDINPTEARKIYLRDDEVIFWGEKTWIPVEITEIKGGFIQAWQTGAKEWREVVAKGEEGFFPVHEAWKLFEPVGLPGTSGRLELPLKEKVVEVYSEEVTKYIDRAIYQKVAEIQEEIERNGRSIQHVNKLGVVYARFGLMDRAEQEFNKVVAEDETYVPALLNLGNIYYLKKDIDKALAFYERAYQNEHDNPHVILCIARAQHQLGNYGIVKKMYDQLKAVDPALAMGHAYLVLKGEEASKSAGIADIIETAIWDEE